MMIAARGGLDALGLDGVVKCTILQYAHNPSSHCFKTDVQGGIASGLLTLGSPCFRNLEHFKNQYTPVRRPLQPKFLPQSGRCLEDSSVWRTRAILPST